MTRWQRAWAVAVPVGVAVAVWACWHFWPARPVPTPPAAADAESPAPDAAPRVALRHSVVLPAPAVGFDVGEGVCVVAHRDAAAYSVVDVGTGAVRTHDLPPALLSGRVEPFREVSAIAGAVFALSNHHRFLLADARTGEVIHEVLTADPRHIQPGLRAGDLLFVNADGRVMEQRPGEPARCLYTHPRRIEFLCKDRGSSRCAVLDQGGRVTVVDFADPEKRTTLGASMAAESICPTGWFDRRVLVAGLDAVWLVTPVGNGDLVVHTPTGRVQGAHYDAAANVARFLEVDNDDRLVAFQVECSGPRARASAPYPLPGRLRAARLAVDVAAKRAVACALTYSDALVVLDVTYP